MNNESIGDVGAEDHHRDNRDRCQDAEDALSEPGTRNELARAEPNSASIASTSPPAIIGDGCTVTVIPRTVIPRLAEDVCS